MRITHLKTPLSKKDVSGLRVGDIVSVNGRIVTARDKIYARIVGGEKSPIDLGDGVIYHCGPLAKRTSKGWRIISAGPTTSSRMDPAQTDFVKLTGVRALIGKGGLAKEVAKDIARLGCIYLAFTGGAGHWPRAE